MHRIRVNNLVFKVREDDYERITRLIDEGGEIIEEEQPLIVEDIPQEMVKDKPTKKRKSRKKRK